LFSLILRVAAGVHAREESHPVAVTRSVAAASFSGAVRPTPLRQWGSTGRGIALEDLKGIRERARLRKPQRTTLHSWTFAQLGAFIAYRAKKAGVPYVDPAYTSQECSRCHHIERGNRPSQARFACRSCGFVDHADRNSSHDIAHRGWMAWVCGVQSAAPELTRIA
jgi:IS605 OrfB family transposase